MSVSKEHEYKTKTSSEKKKPHKTIKCCTTRPKYEYPNGNKLKIHFERLSESILKI